MLGLKAKELNMNNNARTFVATLLAALAVGPVLAKGGPDHQGKNKGHGEHHAYVDRDHYHGGGSCPPGLAKKHNGCLPPGQAKKQYGHHAVVGERLPSGAVYTLPRHVRSTLPPPPIGYRYAVVDNQVVLVNDTNIVVDIVLRSLLG